ncbi:MAG: HAD family hydrolase [Acidobacteriota bacterium]|nr:HAD family hydrolase [Acidobacteriota bacterium]
MKDPALFLDRDGVVNREIGYLVDPNDVVWVPGIFQLCRTAKSLGYRLVIVTNQAGIARGLYTEEQYHALMTWMRVEFRLEGIVFDGVYHCPYHPVHGLGRWKEESEDRKPGAGMLRRAAHDLHLDLSRSVLIGDRCTDIAAAQAASLRQAFLISGTEDAPCGSPHVDIAVLEEAERWLLTHTPQRG